MSSRSFRATSMTPPSVVEWAQLEELTLIDALLVDSRSSWTVESVHDGGEFGWQATRAAADARKAGRRSRESRGATRPSAATATRIRGCSGSGAPPHRALAPTRRPARCSRQR